MSADFDYELLTKRAMTDLRQKTEAAIHQYRLDECAWDVNKSTGVITFTRDTGTKAVAPLQIIGTYDEDESSWLWGWDHPSVAEPLTHHAEWLRRYGEKFGISELTTGTLICEEEACWRFTALACMLNKAHGAYGGPTEGPRIFVTYGAIRLLKKTAPA